MKKILILITILFLILVSTGCSQQQRIDLEAEKAKYADLGLKIVDEKGDLGEALNIYKKLTELFPADHEYRQKVLRYIMDSTMSLVNSAKKEDVQKGLDYTMKLYELLPNDYYLQNRIITAYSFFAKEEMNAKNWPAAKEWIGKALGMRFNFEAMRTKLVILTEEAKELIAQKKYDEAKRNLNEVISIGTFKENTTLFVKETEAAQKLLKKIPQ